LEAEEVKRLVDGESVQESRYTEPEGEKMKIEPSPDVLAGRILQRALLFSSALRLFGSFWSLGRNHLHDFTLAETPPTTEFSARDRALLYKFINGSRMDLQQTRNLGRGENLFHRHIPSLCSSGLPRFSQSAALLPINLRFGTKRKNFNAEDF
jgi:hypothetical protein